MALEVDDEEEVKSSAGIVVGVGVAGVVSAAVAAAPVAAAPVVFVVVGYCG
jgi:hypothetical protein